MTRSDQIEILNDKIKANNAQYDVNRLNAEISAYSSGDLDKYEFLTNQDLKYKPDALEQAKFTYSYIFTYLLKNIEDNLNSNDNNDNGNRKVGIFQIIKDIKDKGIKISNDDETIREIREHIQNLKDEGINVNINNDQVNDLVNKILKGIGKKDSASEDSDSEILPSQNLESFFKKYKNKHKNFL